MKYCKCFLCGKLVELKNGQLNMCCNINYQNGDLFGDEEESKK